MKVSLIFWQCKNKFHNESFNLKESENEPKKYQIYESMSLQNIHQFFSVGIFLFVHILKMLYF